MTRWRIGFFALFLFCAASIGLALYMQHYEFVLPCPLCIFQRIGVMACGALALLAALFPLRKRLWIWPSLLTLASSAGAGVSLRHIQIQNSLVTSDPQTCGAGLDFMLQTNPLSQVIASVLAGRGDCTVIDWQLWGLTLPKLALAGFVLITVWAWAIYYGWEKISRYFSCLFDVR